MVQTKDPIVINGDKIEPETEAQYNYTFDNNGIIEKVTISCYVSQEHSLEYSAYIVKDNGNIVDLFTYAGEEETISGDGERFEFEIRKPISADDELRVYIENIDDTYTYTANIIFELEKETRKFNFLQGVM